MKWSRNGRKLPINPPTQKTKMFKLKARLTMVIKVKNNITAQRWNNIFLFTNQFSQIIYQKGSMRGGRI